MSNLYNFKQGLKSIRILEKYNPSYSFYGVRQRKLASAFLYLATPNGSFQFHNSSSYPSYDKLSLRTSFSFHDVPKIAIVRSLYCKLSSFNMRQVFFIITAFPELVGRREQYPSAGAPSVSLVLEMCPEGTINIGQSDTVRVCESLAQSARINYQIRFKFKSSGRVSKQATYVILISIDCQAVFLGISLAAKFLFSFSRSYKCDDIC